MKKVLLFAASGLLLLNSCSKDLDLYEDPVVPTTEVTAEDIKSNFKNITGVEYSPNMDWTTITSGQVDIQVDASVKKVQLLVDVQVEKNASDDVTPNEVRVLNEAVPNGRTSFTMTYDAPKANLGLYVGFLTDKSYVVKKVTSGKVTSDVPATSRVTRGIADYDLPAGPFAIASEEDPFIEGLQSGYTHGKLYSLADADYGQDYEEGVNDYDKGKLKMAPQEYSTDFKNTFKTMVFATFPNGRKDAQNKPINNLDKVYAIGCYNDFSYGYTTDEDIPVVVTPVYKRDGAPGYGSEIYNSDLYYYYYSDAEYEAAADKKAFLKALPKYKAIPFKKCYSVSDDNNQEQRGSFALLYFEKNEVGQVGTFKFPVGTKIGFMVRAKTDYKETDGKARKKGEVYLDGRLNDFINLYQEMNFKSSGFGDDVPRATWFSIQNRLFLCWESGTDADFNDVILEVEGLAGLVPPPPSYPQVFTFCFEDRKIGDYDLNDIVVKAVRTSETQLTYYLAACGAWDEVYVKNINKDEILDDVEVHAIFGVSTNTFINTESGKYVGMKTATKPVDQKFTFMDPQNQPWVYNKTQNDTIKLSLTGQDPHGIMLPYDFDYPLEKVPVTSAYREFNDWVSEGKSVSETNWYVNPNESRVYVMRIPTTTE